MLCIGGVSESFRIKETLGALRTAPGFNTLGCLESSKGVFVSGWRPLAVHKSPTAQGGHVRFTESSPLANEGVWFEGPYRHPQLNYHLRYPKFHGVTGGGSLRS